MAKEIVPPSTRTWVMPPIMTAMQNVSRVEEEKGGLGKGLAARG